MPTTTENNSNKNDMPDFSTLEYSRPNINNLAYEAKVVKSRLQNLNKLKNLTETIAKFQITIDNYHEQKNLAAILFALDPSNTYLLNEHLFSQQISPSVERLILAVNGWLRNKDVLPELSEQLGQKFIEQIRCAHLLHNKSNQKEWQEEQSLLQKLLNLEYEAFNSSNEIEKLYHSIFILRGKIATKHNYPNYLSYIFNTDLKSICAYEEFSDLRNNLYSLFGQLLPAFKTEMFFERFGSQPQSATWANLNELLKNNLVLALEDLPFGLNSIANRLNAPMDFILQAFHKGYINISSKFTKADGVECFYLPKTKQPFLLGKANNSPLFILELLKETGIFYALTTLSEEYDFTPLIDVDETSKNFIGNLLIMASYSHLNVLYGEYAEFFYQWYLRYMVIHILQLCMFSEFQERLYFQPEANMQSLKTELLHKYFADNEDSLALIDENYGDFLQHREYILDPVYTANLIISYLAALTLVDKFKNTSNIVGKLQAFILQGNKEKFIDRLNELSVNNFLSKDNIKRIVFQICYFMGY